MLNDEHIDVVTHSVRFHPTGEIMVKRENDPWIVAKRSDMRELMIVVNQRNANLKEISGEHRDQLSSRHCSRPPVHL